MSAVVWVGCNKGSDPAVGAGSPAVTLPWLTDLPKAEAQAKQEHKMVFLDFTGSDWCPACIEFHERWFRRLNLPPTPIQILFWWRWISRMEKPSLKP